MALAEGQKEIYARSADAAQGSFGALGRPRYRLPEKLPPTGRDDHRLLATPRLDGYVRVSRLGHRGGPTFISARQQASQIRAYAGAHGYLLERLFVELNRSGSDERRPELQAALARVEGGESNGIIVARLDRLSRNVTGALRAFSRIEAAGGSLISIEDGLNLRTPFGRALSTILLALAELEVARIAESTRSSRSRMVMRGVHHGGSRLTGYQGSPDGRLRPDPRQAPLIIEAFERRAAGATYNEVAQFLRQTEARNAQGGRDWSAKSVYRMLQNPAYVGEAFAGTTRNVDAHPALVRRALWLAALAASSSSRANAHGSTLLAGLVRCAGCCHVLGSNHGNSQGGLKPGRRIYRCRRQHRVGSCERPASAIATALDAAVVDLFLRQLDAQRPQVDIERALSAAEEQLQDAEARTYSHPGWRSAYTDSDGTDLAAARAEVLRRWRQLQLRTLPSAGELRDCWEQLPLADRRRVLTAGIESVILFQGSEPPAERIQLLFAGSRRDWYPKPGLRQQLRPFEPALAGHSAPTDHHGRPSQLSGSR